MLISVFCLVAAALTVGAQYNGLTVLTHQGEVTGKLVTPTVRRFLGVPYAVANRWGPPTSPPLHSKPLKADTFGDSCIQALTPANLKFLKLFGAGTATVPESEDCLSVNIWAPSIKRKQHTAVMLWICGGSFQFGASNAVVYDGQNLVQDHDDIILVSFNYRLNIFGQPNAPQLSSETESQNFGLLDLDAAVQWVYKNIAVFGGDPERITIFGQSAGSAAADAYTFAHPHDTIVKGVIEQSGNYAIIGNGLPVNSTVNPATWNLVADAVGCGTAITDAQFACMKAVPFRTLEDAVISTNATFNLLADDITVFSDADARAAAGNFLQVPLLGGTTAQEGDVFVVVVEELAVGFTLPVITELLSDIQTQLTFTCPAGKTASDRLNAGVPTWRYQYHAVFPDISTRPDLRAYHSSEVPIVFGTYNASLGPPTTGDEVALSKYVQGAWVAFAQDPTNGLLNYGWPRYDPRTASLAQLGNFFNRTGVVFSQGTLLDFTCASQGTLTAIEAQLTVIMGATGSSLP